MITTATKQDGPTKGNACEKIIDFNWCLRFFEKRGKEMFGNHFCISEDDQEIFQKLLIYAIGDKAGAEAMNLDLAKGILLTGPVGCGKTSIMALLKMVPLPERSYVVKPCREVGFEFIKEGYDVIERYGRLSFNGGHARAYCFDDLGSEQSFKYFGNECNVMAEILLSRYDLFMSSNMLTHLTTNMSASEIEDVYGARVRSRMREMFNVVAFEGSVRDKRV